MKATNIGIVKAVISKKMSNDFLSEGLINNSKAEAGEFLNIIKNSPLLQLEFKVFERLENKSITNDIGATRYIDNNLSLFESYSQKELDDEHEKLAKFMDETIALVEGEKYDFYKSIASLIYETLNKENPDVDLIHESFTKVLNHVKKEKVVKNKKTEVNLPQGVDREQLIEVALNKFTEKYESLSESEIKLVKSIASSNEIERKSLFEGLQKENISLLENSDKNGVADKINETIDKIKNMEYTEDSAFKNIISLHQLKNDLD